MVKQVKLPDPVYEDAQNVKDAGDFSSLGDAIRHVFVAAGAADGASYGEQLRTAADIVRMVAETVPEGDFDDAAIEEFEEEFGEVPSLPDILRELESTTRNLSIIADAHAGGHDAD